MIGWFTIIASDRQGASGKFTAVAARDRNHPRTARLSSWAMVDRAFPVVYAVDVTDWPRDHYGMSPGDEPIR